MRLVDLTHPITRNKAPDDRVPVVVRSVNPIHLLALDRLVTPATVVDLTPRPDPAVITRADISRIGVAGIAGCILRTDWYDSYDPARAFDAPELSMEAAAYLLEGGVRTIAADFPITTSASDWLLHNDCVLVHCLNNLASLRKGIVRLIALPLKFEDTLSADARVIAIEE